MFTVKHSLNSERFVFDALKRTESFNSFILVIVYVFNSLKKEPARDGLLHGESLLGLHV